MTPEVAAAARASGIQAYGREEFIDNLADFKPYLAKLLADYQASPIEKLFVPLKTREEVDGETQDEPIPLDTFIDAWLEVPERNHLSLLGDFGTGKTWFTRRLAARLATPANARIPVVIALRDYSRAYDIEQVLTDALTNRFDIKLGAGFKTISRLNQEGRLLLIFDGFDEMERRASDYRTALDNFWEIAKLITPRSKILRHRCSAGAREDRGRDGRLCDRTVLDARRRGHAGGAAGLGADPERHGLQLRDRRRPHQDDLRSSRGSCG